MAQAELKAVISAQDDATPTLQKFKASVGDVAAGVALGQAALEAFRAAAQFATDQLTSSVKSFSESQKVAAQLDAVLKSTKGTVGLTRDELLGLSASLQKTTAFSDETVLSAENMLLTFTNLGKEVFPDATKTVLDMSAALGQDTKSSAIQLGKALNDPIQGLTALGRVGVKFTDDQKDQIATLVESGKTMQAQKVILGELATEFGGSAAAQAQTFDGRMSQLNNSIDDLKERIGEAIVNGIEPFVAKVTEWVQSPAGEQFTAKITEGITKFFAALQPLVAFIQSSVIPAFIQFGDWVRRGQEEANKAGGQMDFLRAVMQPVRDSLELLWLAFKDKLIPVLKDFWEKHGPEVKKILEAFQQFMQSFAAINLSLLIQALTIVVQLVAGAIDLFSKLISKVQAIAKEPILAQLRRAALGPLGLLFPSLEGRASGGPVNAGQPYMVGEYGRELFVPNQAGRIVPTNQVSNSSSATVNFYGGVMIGSGMDAQSVGEMIARQINLQRMGA